MTGSPGRVASVLRTVGVLLMGAVLPISAIVRPLPSLAQDLGADRSFSRLDVQAAVGGAVRTAGMDGWSQHFSADVGARTPYYEGFLELGAHGQRWQSDGTLSGVDGSRLPDWFSVFVFAGAHLEGHLGARADLAGGFRIGNNMMVFDIDAVGGQRFESEMAVAPVVRLQVRAWGQTRIVGHVMWMRSFTAPRMDSVQGSVGVAVPVAIPSWLRRVLE